MKKLLLGLLLVSSVAFADTQKKYETYDVWNRNNRDKNRELVREELENGWAIKSMCVNEHALYIYYEKPDYKIEGGL